LIFLFKKKIYDDTLVNLFLYNSDIILEFVGIIKFLYKMQYHKNFI